MALKTAQRRRSRTMRAATLPFLSALAALLLQPASAQLCEPLSENTWDGLTEAIDNSFGFAILCPFRISGDGCPSDTSGYEVKATDLYVMCENFGAQGDGPECVIDCPGTHFTIHGGASLALDGMKLSGSRESAVRVRSRGSFESYNAYFDENKSASGNGGAIDAASNTKLTLMYSHFRNNEGLNGGAVYQLGEAFVRGSTFIDNKATNGGGGGIFSGSRAETSLIENLFAGNRAILFGPAVFDGSDNPSTRERNIGCNNGIGDTATDDCAIASSDQGVITCIELEEECEAPTATPTGTPSMAPTDMPSSAPSVSPTTAPSAGPSERPSFVPSAYPSLGPSAFPSAVPTVAPSLSPQPSSSPSQAPTLSDAPTSVPSSTPSKWPSATPTGAPSQLPSSAPSMTPSDIPSGEPSTSFAPSKNPTMTPTDSTSPSQTPSSTPSELSRADPTLAPSAQPSTSAPTAVPSGKPSVSVAPSSQRPSTATESDRDEGEAPTLEPTIEDIGRHAPTAASTTQNFPRSATTDNPTPAPTQQPLRRWTWFSWRRGKPIIGPETPLERRFLRGNSQDEQMKE